MSKSKIRVLLFSIFFISLIVWIVSEISDKIQLDRENERAREKISKSIDSILGNVGKSKEFKIDVKTINQMQEYPEDEIIKEDPNNAQAYFDRGVKKFKFLDKEGALADFNKAIELKPKFAEAYHYRAQYYMSAGLGMEDLNKAISLNPKYTEAYKSRAFLKMIGNMKGACQDWEMASNLGDTSCNSMIERFCN
jgi:tetratricopeptide (TPR) repeat protein